MKVLIADDDPLQRQLLSSWLTRWGHEVIIASDGASAWNLIQAHQIGLVISDWMMPDLDGLQLCRTVRAAKLEWYVYMILCTGRNGASDLIEGLESGADDFLTKPIAPDELHVRLRSGERIIRLERDLEERHVKLELANDKLSEAYQKIQDDLAAAALMQKRLLPRPSLTVDSIQFEWLFFPCSFVAGDIFNFFPLDESTVGFYLLDVSGHGIPSAMLSFTLSNLLSPDPMKGSPLKRYDPDLHEYKIIPPAEAAADLNQRFCGQNGDMYFTMVYGTLNTRSRQLRLAQAGHPHPLYLGERSRSVLLGSGGFPVGMLPGIGYDVVEKTLAPGERLFLYSDGVIECENPERQSFTAERLSRILEESRHLPLRESMQRLQEQLEQWRGSDEYEDDVSVLALEI